MDKYIKYINEFHNWNSNEIYFIENQLAKHLETEKEDQTEIEHILDFLYDTKKTLNKIWYKTILKKADARTKQLLKKTTKDNEKKWEDYEIVKDFWDWFKFVKLLSKDSYDNEWVRMSHCVSSYFWKDETIYSLRDYKNKPHCTISNKSWQIKGKWNWKINTKYIKYVVEFLESIWVDIGDNDMENIWYYKLEDIDEWLSCDNLYNWFVYEWDLEKIKDNKWEIYYWMWLLKIKDIFEFNIKLDFKINFDIKKLVKYFVWYNSQLASSWNNSKLASSWDYSQLASSWNDSKLASSWDYSKLASSWDNSKLASSWYNSKLASSWYNSKLASSWNNSKLASSWDDSQLASSWNDSKLASSWDYSKLASSWYNSQLASSWNNSKLASSWDYSQLASSWNDSKLASSWDYSKLASSWDNSKLKFGWKNSVWANIWLNWKIKWMKWSWITLAEYKNNICIMVKSIQIDWKIIKENTRYKLEWWEFTETTIN